MLRRTALLLILLLLAVLLVPGNALGHEYIGDTDVMISLEGDSGKEVEMEKTASYSWELLNANRSVAYNITVTIERTNGNLELNLSARQFDLQPLAMTEVVLSLKFASGSSGDLAIVNVTFNATNQSAGMSDQLTFFTSTELVRGGPEIEIPTVLLAFIAVGAIIFVGFFAILIFERTRVPDLLILIILGLILGPIITTYFGIELVPREMMDFVMPYFAALALVIILFDGGLNLNFDLVLRKINIAFIHTLIVFISTLLAVAAVAHLVLGYPLIVGFLLGAALGGISGAVVITLVRRMKISEETQTILTLESVLTDVLCVIVALALIGFIKGTDDPAVAITSVFAAFSIAFFVALVFGIFWLRILKRLYGKPFSFMITIAALFILYGLVEFVGGSGAMAALIFGLVLGNKDEIARMFKIKTKFVLDERIKQFHSELSFVVRTFFFVFIGLVFTLSLGEKMAVETSIPGLDSFNNTAVLFIIGVVIVFLVIILVRYLAASITVRIHPESKEDKFAVWIMMGRGLAAAVLASLPFTISAFKEGNAYYDLMSPYKEQFLNLAFLIILFSVVVTTAGVIASERRRAAVHPLEMERLRHEREQEAARKRELRKKMDQERRMRIAEKKMIRRMKDREK